MSMLGHISPPPPCCGELSPHPHHVGLDCTRLACGGLSPSSCWAESSPRHVGLDFTCVAPPRCVGLGCSRLAPPHCVG